jgi:uncharacterized protein YndB with AHSA1/START domain
MATYATVALSIEIAADPQAVWDALVSPNAGSLWRNADFATRWTVGERFQIRSTIGTKRYSDKGVVLALEPPRFLRYAHWSRVSGLPDAPDSYSTISIHLEPTGEGTRVTVNQATPPSPVRRGRGWEIGPESGAKHAEFYWRTTLAVLKRLVEAGPAAPA